METGFKHLYDLLALSSERFPDKETFCKRTPTGIQGRTFAVLKKQVDEMTAGWIAEGVVLEDKILFLCDSSTNWFFADLSIITSGAACVPRGTDVVDEDILYIVNHSESRFAVVQRNQDKERLIRLAERIPSIEKIFVLEDDLGELNSGEDGALALMKKGREYLIENPNAIPDRLRQTSPDRLATLIYTSGTTGAPKGVMLNQTGWIAAIDNVVGFAGLSSEDSGVSLLPPWHAFERAIEYCTVALGVTFLISNITSLRDDLRDFRPTLFPSVPRIWESLYNGIMTKVSKESALKRGIFSFFLKVGEVWAHHKSIFFGYDFRIEKPSSFVRIFRRLFSLCTLVAISPLKLGAVAVFSKVHQALGGRLRISVSAGSALPSSVDKFLSAIGLIVLEGYGMTETSALTSIRKPDRPTSGTVGIPVEGYEYRLKDENGNSIPNGSGEKGTLWLKSKQILTGYYKRPDLNEIVFDRDGFFDTGDIMRINFRGELCFAGRAKDTIVLAGGENVEPVPIEDHLLNSPYINQVMVTGHESKHLVVLIVPDFDRMKTEIRGLPEDVKLWNQDTRVREIFRKELSSRISRKNGFKAFELVPQNAFYVLPRPFDPDKEMTRTLKMKRNEILESYKKEIAELIK
ncbi:long-chain fatty acid--CoA ligase [Leptospira gomenensis]|uniref:Long-chain fatty acid--CoA ligase n=1 Tax=Leptospira gomenensis TaxID=2484974 RepID=A0A5F1Y6S7_9LEPT|nr:AMP-binding protein [Leptospira gomenensis]TGK28167.1 long-chain fatty acid--CoA ligase [Leptospira gomenensis]TGK36979.1 long-chain fatty acid--CoA ligase [Leptospira gomenensis]TGK45615.1 long-chain fatty acid--CoA ligase [Leptospira gomenensis]TGK59554.1 long-chain fatty acid--CoA ligase [Leptospira gomenensis]